jgi:hypothetical protein
LNPLELQVGYLGSSQAAPNEETQHGGVSFALKSVSTNRAHKSLTLLGRQPVADRMCQALHGFDPADSRYQIRAEQAVV